jgi:hypothetical protein
VCHEKLFLLIGRIPHAVDYPVVGVVNLRMRGKGEMAKWARKEKQEIFLFPF